MALPSLRGELWEAEDEYTRRHVGPRNLRQPRGGEPEVEAHPGESGEQGRLAHEGDPDPQREQRQHRGDARIGEEQERQRERDSREEQIAPRHLHAFDNKAKTQTQDNSLDDGASGDLLNPRDRAGPTHQAPDHPGKEARGENRAVRDRPGLRDGRRADGLHRLDRHRRLEVEARPELEHPEGDEDTRGVHVVDGDVADHERDQGAEVAERARQLLHVVRVPARFDRRVHRRLHDRVQEGSSAVRGAAYPYYTSFNIKYDHAITQGPAVCDPRNTWSLRQPTRRWRGSRDP